MDKNELKINIEMCFEQIEALTDLIIEKFPLETALFLTIKDLAEKGKTLNAEL